MTISSENNRNDYTGNGSTDTYAYTFKIFAEGEIKVTERDTDDIETVLVLNTDYTVTDVGVEAGGTVVLTAGNLTTDHELCIRRNNSLLQLTEIRNQGIFFANVHEDAWDYLCMIAQTQQFNIDKALKMPDTVTGVSADLPIPVASQFLSWNAAADALINVDPGSVSLAIPAGDSVATAMIQDLAVTTAKIANDAITAAKIPDTSIQHGKIDFANLVVVSSNTTKVILAGATWLVPAGVFHFTQYDAGSWPGTVELEMHDGSAWISSGVDFKAGPVISDGTNIRFREVSAGSCKLYYHQL